jgi:cysteine-rich repeat protein
MGHSEHVNEQLVGTLPRSVANNSRRRLRWLLPLLLLVLMIPTDSKGQPVAVCGDGIVDDAETCDDGNLLDGDCCSSTCTLEADGSTCNDQDLCSQTDTCLAGACVGGNPVVCTPLSQCHDATCDPATGLCSDSLMPDPALLVFAVEADTHTDFDQPAMNFGDQLNLRVDGRPGRRVYLRFDVSGITDLPIQSAVVRMQTTSESPSSSDQGGDIHLVSDNGWDELTLTHDNRPLIDGPLLDSVGAVGLSETVDFDVTAALTSDGLYTFGIEAASNNMAIYHSREGIGNIPELIVTIYAPCDDGNGCTQLDNCVSGTCVGTDPVICEPLDQCHDAGTCNPGSGLCSDPAKADGTTCDDGDACSTTDECSSGVCAGTGLSPDGTTCDDGSACTLTDTCNGGACIGTDPIICVSSGQCHEVGVCDPVTGACSDPAKIDGTPCDDDDLCTQSDSCIGGKCNGANPVVCPEADQCHQPRTCKKSTGICSDKKADDGVSCDDGNACTRTDTCDDGACVGENPVTCTPLSDCHVAGVCDVTTGECANPPAVDGLSCDDRNVCTDDEICIAGECLGQSAPDADGDGVCDVLDLCRDFPDAAQIDADHDGIGDFCQCTSPAPGRCIPGGGSKRTDCLMELATVGQAPLNRKGTKVTRTLKCIDGDPTCDVDGAANGQCTFGVALCFGNADPRFSSCEPSAVVSIEVLKPSAKKSVAAQRLEAAVAALGAEVRRRRKVVSPTRGPVDTNVCSPMIQLPVSAPTKGRATKAKFKLRAAAASGQ